MESGFRNLPLGLATEKLPWYISTSPLSQFQPAHPTKVPGFQRKGEVGWGKKPSRLAK